MKRIPLDIGQLHRFPLVAPDCETTGLHWYRDKMFGIALAGYDPEEQIMMSGYIDIRDHPHAIKHLRKELPRCKRILNHNVKFDSLFLLNEGIVLPDDRIECTSVRAALINEHEHSFGLDALGKKYAGMGKETGVYEKLAKMFGGLATANVQMPNLHRAPASLAAEYAIADPEIACLLWLWQEGEIARQDLHKVWGLEKALTPVLIGMERQGVRVDVKRTRASQKVLDAKIADAQKKLDGIAGRSVNANSPKQMRELLEPVERAGGWYVGDVLLTTTETGQPSLDADALRTLTDRGHPAAEAALSIRKLTKAKSFLKDHILGHELDGYVFPNYNQTRGDNELGTGTGRFSINDPALQQIPARDIESASIVRSCFIPEDGHDWVCGDWEQFEFRWFAHYTKDPSILEAYRNDPSTDFHQIVSDLTGVPRKPRFAGDANAKQINLGLVFGMGQGKLASEMGMPHTVRHEYNSDGSIRKSWLNAGPEAIEVFNKYHDAIPGVKKLLDRASSIARSRGYVQTAMGRHIRFPGGKFTHKAGGLIFQGTSADCMKVKMVELWPVCKDAGIRMLLTVHDELDFSTPKGKTKKQSAEIKRRLEVFDGIDCPIRCDVPIRSSLAHGSTWWEASK